MKLYDIAINNLRRRKIKALFLVIGLMIGVASVVAMLTASRALEEDIAHKMDEYGANIVIAPKSKGLSLSYGGLNLGGVSFDLKALSQADLKKIRTIENADNIRIISPKLFGVFEYHGENALAVGVDFTSEFLLKPWWKLSGVKPASGNEILAGETLAERFRLIPGSEIVIKGTRLKVAGVLHTTGSQDDNLLFMALSKAQMLFNKSGEIAMAEVAALCKNCPITEIVRQISEKIPDAKVTAVQQVVQGRMETLAGLKKFSLGVSGIVLFVGAMVVFVTMMANVNERTREIGIFSAIGFRRSHIMRIILLEAMLVSLSAGIFGYFFGIGGTHVLLTFFFKKISYITLDPLVAAGAVFISVIIGIVASIYPAAIASRMDPNEALRTL